jgi:Mg-chelatase subunit ChlD
VNAPTPIVHIYVLLDRSGSMSTMAEQVVAGFNRLLTEQQADGHDARMTLVRFDDEDPREVVFQAVPIAEVVALRARDFEPRGMTPLLDATGSIIDRAARRATELAEAGGRPEQVLVVTITDGEENHSREFTRRQVVDLVRAKEADGWTFAFLGAGLDAYQEAGSMGYAGGSVQAWMPDAAGADIAFTSLSSKTTDLRRKLRRGEALPTGDFFEGDKPAEVDRRKRGSR